MKTGITLIKISDTSLDIGCKCLALSGLTLLLGSVLGNPVIFGYITLCFLAVGIVAAPIFAITSIIHTLKT